tara:strand:+ start:4856 stop:5566 length:711 start_codon:yes stop_codon:yes gene_type:complete
MKLKQLLKEVEEATAQKLTREQKRNIIDSVQNFNSHGKSVYRESDIKELVETLKELSSNATSLAVNEAGDWFDSISVKRDMKEVNTSVGLFEKTANEISQLQQRLESVFEDIGSKLGKYYEIAEAVDHIDDKEADTKFDDLKDKDVDNDGDTDDSDEYLHHKLGVTAKKTEGRLKTEAAPKMRTSKETENIQKLIKMVGAARKAGGSGRYGKEFETAKKQAIKAMTKMLTYSRIGG